MLGALVNVLAFARFPVSYFVVIIGEALALSRPVLYVYLLAVVAIVAGFVHWWEEPAMARHFGAAYEACRRQVPGWWPRRPRRQP